MKNYVKKYRTLDERNLQVIRTNLNVLQNSGAYPTKMTYPITLQFELTGQLSTVRRLKYMTAFAA